MKQFAHLSLSQPYCFIGEKHINLYYSIFGFVYYNLVIHNFKTVSSGLRLRVVVLSNLPPGLMLYVYVRESTTNHNAKYNKIKAPSHKKWRSLGSHP